jgi:hypothetical protein
MRYQREPGVVTPGHAVDHVPPWTSATTVTLVPVGTPCFSVLVTLVDVRRLAAHDETIAVGDIAMTIGTTLNSPLAAYR